jgi:8-oxo-dGTP pyrophosphatase MutT (NUDIX family)
MKEGNPWKLLSTKVVYKNPWMQIHEDTVVTPTGTQGIYGYMESNDSVMVVVLNEKNEVYVVRTFRYPLATWNWELPGGGGDKEHPMEASKRELEEETGITAEEWTELGRTAVCNGFMTESMATYLARGLSFTGTKETSSEQVIDAKFVSLDEIDAMITRGDINDGQSITALYLLKKWLAEQPAANTA